MCRCSSCLHKVTISSLCLASFLLVSSSSRWLMVPIPTCGYRRDAHGKKLQHKTELLLNCKLFHTFQRHHNIDRISEHRTATCMYCNVGYFI